VLDEGPFERFLRAVNVDSLAVLPGGVEEGAIDARAEIRVFELDVGGFDGERGFVIFDESFADGAGAEAGDVFGDGPGQREHGYDTMRRIPHWGQAGPIIGPAVHVLLMTRLEKLNFAELALFVEVLDVKKLAGIDDGFHHHVLLPRLLHEIHDLLAVLDAGRHGYGASDVFAGFERGDGLPGVIGNG